MTAALWAEASRRLVSLLTCFARDQKTGFIFCLQGTAAEVVQSGSLACESHSGEVFGLKVTSQKSPVSDYPFSAAGGRLSPVSHLLCWETDTNATSRTMSGLDACNTAVVLSESYILWFM